MKPQRFPVVYITDVLAQRTAGLLDSFASTRPSEGVVYWFGIETTSTAVVTTLVVPEASTRDGAIHTSVHANAKAMRVIVDTPLVYIGQAHSHPGPHVSHSSIDDRETFAIFDGVVSIVVPWFGRYGLNLEHCGVYRHLGGRFCRIEDVASHFRILPSFADLRTDEREALVHDE